MILYGSVWGRGCYFTTKAQNGELMILNEL